MSWHLNELVPLKNDASIDTFGSSVFAKRQDFASKLNIHLKSKAWKCGRYQNNLTMISTYIRCFKSVSTIEKLTGMCVMNIKARISNKINVSFIVSW